MPKSGPIILIEDDADDREIFAEIVKELHLPNELKCFADTDSAWKYLKVMSGPVFLIFCDINLPARNGLEFKRYIDADPELRHKAVPFIFLSTQGSPKDATEAYNELVVQGFFKKRASYKELRELLKTIFAYWAACIHPQWK